MKIEKEKRKVCIVCSDGSLIKGFVHVNPGERTIDFINDEKEKFIAVTEVEFSNVEILHSFKFYKEMEKRNVILLSKAQIKLVEEI